MKVGFEFGVVLVTSVSERGAVAYIPGQFDAVKPTQIEALRALEARLVSALSDVRSLIDTLEATR